MGFESINMPSPAELDKIQKEHLTEEQIDQDKIREEAFLAGMEKQRQSESAKQEMKAPTKEKLGLHFENFPGFWMDVAINDGKVVEVLKDIEARGFVSYGEDNFEEALEPLFSAGVEINYDPWTNEDGEDLPGEIYIKKESLNKAIVEGKIVISKNEEGSLVIE